MGFYSAGLQASLPDGIIMARRPKCLTTNSG